MIDNSSIKNALTIAGSDSGGGAGIQADLKAFSALGVYGSSVITALTAQNTRECRGIVSVDPDFILQQLETVCDDIEINGIKTGMLGDSSAVKAVAGFLEGKTVPLVVDPVMIAKSGDALLKAEAVSTLVSELFPLATLITPNLPEAAAILGQSEPETLEEMEAAAVALHKLGAKAVLLKGGHLEGELCQDLLYDGENFFSFSSVRIPTTNTHGTGCTLASAITASLAKGESLKDAVKIAKNYITEAIKQADKLNVGGGHGPVNHFHSFW
jgi:hydroxymethylpyrimidine kinase/phosphomethylpyrimidine kinase